MPHTDISTVRAVVRDFPAQLRNHAGWYIAVLAVVLILLAYVVYLHHTTHIIVTELFEDPVEFGVLPLHVGIYNYLGALALVVGGSLLLFAASCVVDAARATRFFPSVLGGFFLWLGIDDLFMIHEWLGLRLAWLVHSDDVPRDRQWLEGYVFAAYAVVWAAIVIGFRRYILRTAWILLAMTLAGMAVSVVLDLGSYLPLIPSPTTGGEAVAMFVAEDMAKLAGGLFSLAYAIHLARQLVRGNLAPSMQVSGT